MVFESIVADVLNRFLGDFINNLDPSKLNVGIWGGDVTLKDLEVKETALDDLDLPIKLKFGCLDSLVLKIPWKYLYTEPVLADIEGLHLIVVPNKGVVYNETKAKKNETEIKQKLLNRLEENRKNKRKPKVPDADTFTEKLVAQIIKNLQIKIRSIHVRYEDKYSHRNHPFAAGITLEGLDFQTTDSNFEMTIHKEVVKIFYKLVSLKSLAVYWNSNSGMVSDLQSKDEIRAVLKASIGTDEHIPDKYKYIFGPISVDTRLTLNQKPEMDGSNWSTPKINLKMEMGKLSLFIGKRQYQDLLLFLDAQERFNLAGKYLKYRPDLIDYHGHAKEWWLYAYNCVLEEIRRKKQDWSWPRMKEHVQLVKDYKRSWVNFRTQKNVPVTCKQTISMVENKLDVFNLNIARQQAEMEIDRRNLIRTEDQEVQTWGSWAKSWFVSSGTIDLQGNASKTNGQQIVSQIEKAITPEEKKKLFDAIAYQENIPATDYPKHYVENRVHVTLSKVVITVEEALTLVFKHLWADFEHRCSAKAFTLKTGVKSLSMDGCGLSMLSLLDTSKEWLEMEIATNPLDGCYDHYVKLHIAPVLLKYHSPVVNRFLDVFKPPGDVRLNRLTTAAMARYEEVKARSAIGLQYAIEQKAKMKLRIKLEPATIVVSQNGIFDENNRNLMAELGVLTISTVDDVSGFNFGDSKDESLRKLVVQAYEKFQIQLSNVQLIFANNYKNCMAARGSSDSHFHILKPMKAEVNLCKATIDDLQIPRIRINGTLPNVAVCISDERLAELLNLLVSIPMPEFEDEIVNMSGLAEESILRDQERIKVIMDASGFDDGTKSVEQKSIGKPRKNIIYEFKIGEMSILLCSKKKTAKNDEETADAFGEFNMKELVIAGYTTEDMSLKCELKLSSFTMEDKRIHAKISRLLDKKQSSSASSLFHLLYEQHPNGVKKVMLSSSRFYLLLNAEFLGLLSNFVNSPQKENTLGHEPALSHLQIGVSSTQQSKLIGAAGLQKNKTMVEDSIGSLTMECRIHDIEVILIENPLEPDESQALILTFNAFCDAKKVNGIQTFEGKIQNLQVSSTYFAEHKRAMSSYSVLQKLEIELSGNIEEETKAQAFAIRMDQVSLRVSTAVIRLLGAVSNQFSSHQPNASFEKSMKIGKIRLKQYTDYWAEKKIEPRKYWWFQEVAKAAAADTFPIDLSNACAPPKYSQRVEFIVERFFVTVEAGVGDFTCPMILVDTSLNAVAENWSSNPTADAKMHLQVSYYNEAYSIWEPVIEPVLKKETSIWESWQLAMQIRSYGELDEGSARQQRDDQGNRTSPPVQMPKMSVNVEATEMMNITVTKSFIQLVQQLINTFEEAANQKIPPIRRNLPGSAPYLLSNNTGVQLRICNSETLKVTDMGSAIDAAHSAFIELQFIGSSTGMVGLQFSEDQRRSILCVEMLGKQYRVNVMRAEKRCIRLPQMSDAGKKWRMLVDTRLQNSRHVVYLRSLLNFVNHMEVPLEIYSSRSNKLLLCGVAQPDEDPVYVPLPLLYTQSGQFYLTPTSNLYEMSEIPICWHEFEQVKRITIACSFSTDVTRGLYIDAVIEEEKVMSEKGTHHVAKLYTVHLFAPVFLRNLLPVPLQLTRPVNMVLQGGEGVRLNVKTGLAIEYSFTYKDVTYEARTIKKRNHDDIEPTQFCARDDNMKLLCLGLNWSTQRLQQDMSLYAPYWMVNNTGKILQYSVGQNRVEHIPGDNPCLLHLSSSHFLDNKKAKLRVDQGSWSEEFALHTVGSQARVICQGKDEKEYEVTIDVKLCQSGLTKVVTISPFYLVYNSCLVNIEVRESGSREWMLVNAESCVGLWSVQTSKKKTMTVRFYGDEESSLFFPFTGDFNGFCSIKNNHLGVYVVCTVSESSSIIRVEPFVPGMAPAVLMNATKYPIKFLQTSVVEKKTSMKGEEEVLRPWQLKAYTWTDVSCPDRSLGWICGDYEGQDDLMQNRFESYLPNKKSGYHYWCSFLNGRQRVLLFTNDIAIMTTAYEAYEVERLDYQVELNLHGIGVSLVNNIEGMEVLYMSMSSSDIIWEQRQRNRYKPLSVKEMQRCELEYQTWLSKGSPSELITSGNYELDFTKMTMQKKEKRSAILSLRRCFQKGIWMQYKKSPHQTRIHFKLNHIQIDNQMPACVFPCVLAAVPPPKSVVADNAPRPFAECSYVISQSEHTKVVQVKYYHVLVQEFAICVDNGLLNAVLRMFSAEAAKSPPYTAALFTKDMELTTTQLSQRAIHVAASQVKAYYEDLHISPLFMHLSFSQGGSLGTSQKSSGADTNIQSEFFNVILKSLGVTVTELQDIVFKLGYFERKAVFYSREELLAEVSSHYTKQFMKQLYVLVFGLDIIGNPYGLVRDLSAGVVDLFYQPFQGAIQGPEEFAEGAALGFQSLFSHTLGGSAAAVSRIAGTLGKGIAALTLDKEFQRKRQEALNRKPKSISEGLSRSVKGVGHGVYDGVTGVFLRPYEGAKEGGVSGFAKGLGKGLLGVVVRPVSGVVDFASGTLDTLKTIASNDKETKPTRLPRVILNDQVVRPFSREEAIGFKIFRDTDHGKYAHSDHFVCHAFITGERVAFIVTDVRVILTKHKEMMGSWTSEWSLSYQEIKEPRRTENSIFLELKKKKSGFLGLGASGGKIVEFKSVKSAEQIAMRLIHSYDVFA